LIQKAPITGLAITSTDQTLVSVSRDKSIRFFDVKTQELQYFLLNAHNGIDEMSE